MPFSLAPPVLSAFDPTAESDSGIDPLGLIGTYDHLANRILPALTVRMSRPRFLTAMAVAARACEHLDEDAVAADGVTPPWMVFEWFTVEAMARTRDQLKGDLRIPGMLKVETALRMKRPIGRANYLKTATVFGFTGVYKRLALSLEVLTSDLRLDDAGYELLAAWQKDQELEGFLHGEGAGATFLARVRRAIEQGLAAAHTTPQPGTFWEELARRLDPGAVGTAERRVLLHHLRSFKDASDAPSGELVEAVARHGKTLVWDSEAGFLRGLAASPKTSPELRERLTAIDAFETLARPLTDAMNLLRVEATVAEGGMAPLATLARTMETSRAVPLVREGVRRVREHPRLLEWEPAVRVLVERFGPCVQPRQLLDTILEHHERTQAEKPPDGKRSWFERGRQDAIGVRAAYLMEDPPTRVPPYVHEYRTPSLSRFISDLRGFA